MKLQSKYQQHSEIFKNGYIFNPDEGVFYVAKRAKKNDPDPVASFVKPEGYHDWNVVEIDFKEYGSQRLKEIGVTTKNNKIKLIGSAQDPKSSEEIDEDIFSVNKHGSIEILQFGLDRRPHFKDKNKLESEGKGIVKGLTYCFQERLHPIKAEICEGKYDFSNAKSVPFWPPQLVNDFQEKSEVETLVITEGQFKSFVGALHGIKTVGLTSISHFRDQETKSLHPEIVEFVQECKVKKVVILWDGDCTNISSKDLNEKNDLTTRPNQFYRYAQTIRDELKKFIKAKNFSIYFATILSEKIDGEPKGLDDLLLSSLGHEVVKKEFDKIGDTPTKWIHWEEITTDNGVKNMRRFFGFQNVKQFYDKHRDLIGSKDFVFFGSTHKVEKGVPIIEIPKDLKLFKRIGTEYYHLIETPVPNGKKGKTVDELRLVPWSKSTIIDDYGKDSIKDIERLKGFTNIASHIDYEPIVRGHYNLYYNVDHKFEEGDFPTIRYFLNHLFEEHEENEMIYDYLTILFRNPMQKLPVVCLVSKEQSTGKSTFIYLLKLIFKQNLTIISNNDLVSEFNSHWTSSLIVACEETVLEKKEGYEKIKNLSTAFEITRNEKNKTSQPIPCMLHFVFCSNHEDDFIRIDDHDSRLWIRKVKSRNKTIQNFDSLLETEIPQFVNFIANREIKYQSKGERLFFEPEDFMTDAKKNIIVNSEPSVIKDLKYAITEYFLRFGTPELHMTTANIKQYFGIKGEPSYLNKVIKSYLSPGKSSNATTYSFLVPDHENPDKGRPVKDKGRCFIFKSDRFVKPQKGTENKKEKKQKGEITVQDLFNEH